METAYVGGREVRFDTGGDRRFCAITFFADFSADDAEKILTGIPYPAFAVRVGDWRSELSPWEFHSGDSPFGGRGEDMLRYITGSLIPFAEGFFDTPPAFVIGGYSLAGLFSLWASCVRDGFHAVAAASPSVWFPGWIGFLKENPCRCGYVHLRLGDRERRSRDPLMSSVEERIIETRDIISAGCGCSLEFDRGGHFDDVAGRTVRAFVSAVSPEHHRVP